jgi:hypothetical protein
MTVNEVRRISAPASLSLRAFMGLVSVRDRVRSRAVLWLEGLSQLRTCNDVIVTGTPLKPTATSSFASACRKC